MKIKVLVAVLIWVCGFGNNIFAQYISSTVEQVSAPYVNLGSVSNPIIRVRIDIGPTAVSVDSLIIAINGVTKPTDILEAKVFYTTDTVFSTLQQYGTTWYVNVPTNMPFVFTQTLSSGSNYFWLTYDITSNITSCGNAVDADCYVVSVNSVIYIPTVPNPSGNSIICGPTGISTNNPQQNQLTISPNPATDKVYISFPATASENITIKIFSITGEVVFEQTDKSTSPVTGYQLPVTNISNGIYFLSVQTGMEVMTRKIVVNH